MNDVVISNRSCRPTLSITGSCDIAVAPETLVDVFLQGNRIPAVWISFLHRTCCPLPTVGQVLLQAAGPFRRMIPDGPTAACHAPKDTAHTQQHGATYQEGRPVERSQQA